MMNSESMLPNSGIIGIIGDCHHQYTGNPVLNLLLFFGLTKGGVKLLKCSMQTSKIKL